MREVAAALERGVKEELIPAIRDTETALKNAMHSVADGAEKVAARTEATEAELAAKLATVGTGGAGGLLAADASRAGRTASLADDGLGVRRGGQGSDGNGGCHGAGDPVDVVSGQMITSETDLSLPGLLPLVLRRAYASGYASGRLFGPGWSSTLDQRVVIDADAIHFAGDDAQVLHYPVPTRPGQRVLPDDGARWPLTWDRAADDIRIEDVERGWTWHFTAPSSTRGRLETRPLTALSDRDGHRITYLRDQDGVPVEVLHSGGYRVGVDATHTVAGVRVGALRLLDGTENGRGTTVVGYRYDPLGRLVGIVNSSGLPHSFEYDNADQITAWTDRNGNRYEYEYDGAGRIVRGVGQDGYLSASFTYDADNRVTLVTNSLGNRTEYHYDEHEHIARVADPLGNTTVIGYDRYGQLLSHTDPLGHTTRYTLDRHGDPTRVERPDGTHVSVTYDGHRRLPTRIENPGGAVWQHSYSETGNLLTTTDPLGALSTCVLDGRGHLSAAVDPDGQTWRFDSDGAGRPLAVTSPLGASSRYALDGFGRVTATTAPDGAVTRYGWTVEGLLAWQIDPDGGRQELSYDPQGNLVRSRNPGGGVTTFEPGPFNVILARTGPDGTRYTFAYDTELRLVRVTNPAGLAWDYEYDAAGNLVRESDFTDRVVAYRHDAAGRQIARAEQGGWSIGLERDGMGRVVAWRVQGAVEGAVEGTRGVEFAYDEAGRLSRASDGTTELTYRRDPLGRPLAESVGGLTVTSEYDLLGRRTRRVTASGVESRWEYTPTRREASLAGTVGGLTFEYDIAGREIHRRIGAGVALGQSFDALGRMTEQSLRAHTLAPAGLDRRAPDRVIQRRTYGYRTGGTVSTVGDLLRGDRAYGLTGAGRVTSVTGESWSERYTYDPLGNLTVAEPGRESDTSGTRRYDGLLLRSAGRTRYEYDGQGRIVRAVARTLSGRHREWTYTWNALGRLAAVTTPDGHAWRYTYDPLGRRVAKQRLDQGAGVLEETRFVWDGADLAEQHHEVLRGGPVAATTWDYHAGTGRPVAQTTRSWLADAPGEIVDSRFHAIVTDLVGAPTELVTPDGQLAWRLTTSLWGGQVAVSTEDDTHCPLRFPGQYHDAETGLHYNFYRYYDPRTARYLTPDPLGLAAAPNHYAYVTNPVIARDPLGLAGYRGDGGRYAHDPSSPPNGHNRGTEYPHDYWPSTHDAMVAKWTIEGRTQGGVPVDKYGVRIPRDQLTWVDANGNRIPFDQLTYDHNPPVVEHWTAAGYDQSAAEREAWYNRTDDIEAATRSDNSSKGAKLDTRYSDRAPGPNYCR